MTIGNWTDNSQIIQFETINESGHHVQHSKLCFTMFMNCNFGCISYKVRGFELSKPGELLASTYDRWPLTALAQSPF